ncbi:type II secretion system protein N [Marilutibacter chinensis]|uniref:Type II secretion system protein C n=1 Tax=Marilutibacter chinensis TaxID=2912247 RepID=A0ABS9HW97_9GAMM|nr:type II secretion system protein C [Lysobacter chinensis]
MPALSAIRDISDPAVHERLRHSLPQAIEIVLVLLLAVQAARMLWLIAVPPAPFGQAALPSAPEAVDSTTAAVDLFYRQSPASAVVGADEALGYRLFGLRAASTDGSLPGSAILAGKDDLQQAYRIGDSIAPGITLARVAGDHVILRAGGGEHRIDLAASAPAKPGHTTARLSTGGAATETMRTPVAVQTGSIAPAQLLASTGLRAALDGGYTLTPRGDGALFRQAGLEAGDVLMAINGRPLDRERLGELENELENRAEAVLTVRRGGQTRTITLQAKQP